VLELVAGMACPTDHLVERNPFSASRLARGPAVEMREPRVGYEQTVSTFTEHEQEATQRETLRQCDRYLYR
jgi:hypothetical protein